MIELPFVKLRHMFSLELPRYDLSPLQLGMGIDPWRVAVCSMLLCRSRRMQAQPVLQVLLNFWPSAPHLARANESEVEAVVRPCGLQRNRARQLIRFSSLYLADTWQDMRELPGVGAYVADAVGLFCLGCTELDSSDGVLRKYAESLCAR